MVDGEHKISVTVKYKAGHSSTHPMVKTNEFCRNCGKQEIWLQDDEGDYYAGQRYICSACSYWFDSPNEGFVKDDDEMSQIIGAIRQETS